MHLPRAELERFDRRPEYWDAATETAAVCEPVAAYHERPAGLLGRLAERIAQVRGSRIECFGSMDLLLRDDRSEPQRVMQADESLYLHPDRAKLTPKMQSMSAGRMGYSTTEVGDLVASAL